MKNRKIEAKTPNGWTVQFKRKDVRGIGAKLNDGTYLDIEFAGGFRIPIHPDSGRSVILNLYSDERPDVQ